MTFGAVIFAFGVIPLLELLFKPDPKNIESAELEMRKDDRAYDFMLYMVLPAVYLSVAAYLFALEGQNWQTYEIVGLTLSLSMVLGGLGINVAHELGHRNSRFEKTLGKLLLLPSGYMHFFIEHNYGHHKNVSTHEDPASSRRNETLYHFWIRSAVYGYISAWHIQKKQLERSGKSFWSLKNEMLIFQIIQLAWWAGILFVFGWKVTLVYTIAAIGGFLLLETVNYIEHYGLARKKLSELRYERVRPAHSWNSNHVVGRLMLFELSRHSDHHFQPAKKYQLLEHHPESPQMPTGYPGMMLLSAVPPLWFAVMNKRLPDTHASVNPAQAAAA
ncbi:MAG: alkane 1-monooxygenase [Flavobacteriales bacterium]|nr:alkane 1-monooxygenase [Flavobacteriales bacterium]